MFILISAMCHMGGMYAILKVETETLSRGCTVTRLCLVDLRTMPDEC